MSTLAPTLQAFFTERLIGQLQASPNTIAAYRDTKTAPHPAVATDPWRCTMHTRQPLTDEEREQRRAEQRELVKASIEQLRRSEGWQAYLRARRAFHTYTPLILRPGCRR